MAILQNSRLKIDRANVHIHDLEVRVAALQQTDTAIVEIHPEHGTERLTHTLELGAFDDLAVVIGDAVHNLKCSLDYTWLQTIQRLVPQNVNDRAKFPVYKTVEELQGVMRKGDVQTACHDLFTFMVCAIQPYEGGNSAIWPLHNFDNRDKHRLLIPVLSQGHVDGIEVQDEAGELHRGFGASDFQRPPYCIDFERGLHVTKKGKLTARISVEDGKSGCFMDIPETLMMYSQTIVGVVESFERFLESQ